MVTARTQRRQIKAAEKEAVAAEAKIAQEVAKAAARVARTEVTAEDLIRERDEKGLSWRQVGINLDIGSPSAARKAYTMLTGRPHYESQMKEGARAKPGTARRKTFEPVWFDDSDQDEIIEAITHRTIVVARTIKRSTFELTMPEERVHVSRIVKFAFDGKNEDGPLVVHIVSKDSCDCATRDSDAGRMRCFRVADIKEVI
jgi:hypothetical protein